MDNIFITMVPIFNIILLGYLLKHLNFVPEEFWDIANRVVFYIAIPAMIFHSTCHFAIQESLNLSILWVSGYSIIFLFILSRFFCYITKMPKYLIGSVCQCSFHGNIGYVGLSIIFYYIGPDGIASSSIVTIFIIILQNFLSIIGFQIKDGFFLNREVFLLSIKLTILNPVVVSSLLGLLFSMTGLIIPNPLDRTLDILSGFSLPVALLIIGRSLSYIVEIKKWIFIVFFVCLSKLIILPLVALIIFYYNSFSGNLVITLILLGSPTATVSCIMAKEMGGDPNFSAMLVSLTTLCSILTISFWLKILVLYNY